MTVIALQFDVEMAMQALFRAKHSLNYAVHAASQQLDDGKLANGIFSIDKERARSTAELYLRHNMQLDSHSMPIPGSFLESHVEVLAFEVMDETLSYPFTYVNEAYDYRVTLDRPGVVMVINVEFPRTYRILRPITWQIKGCSELVFGLNGF